MTRQFQTGSRVGVFTFFFVTVALHADVVHLRDGRVLENVRTELRGGVLFVSPPGGAMQRIPVDKVLRIEPGPVRIPPSSPVDESESTRSAALPQIADRERAAAGRRRESRPARDSGAALSTALAASGASSTEALDRAADSPSVRAFQDAAPVAGGAESAAAEEDALAYAPPSRGRLFLEGLAPGWSGLFRRGDVAGYGGGAVLGSLEIFLAYHVALFHQSPVPVISGPFYNDSSLYLELVVSGLSVAPLNDAASGLGTYAYFTNVTRINGLVRHPLDGSRWITRRELQTLRNNSLGALAGTLVLDGILSAVFGGTQTDQGAGIAPRDDGVDVRYTLTF